MGPFQGDLKDVEVATNEKSEEYWEKELKPWEEKFEEAMPKVMTDQEVKDAENEINKTQNE